MVGLSGTPREVVDRLRAWLDDPDPGPLVVETSGSTGAPKRVLLTRDALLASIHASARRLGASGRWLLALPASYVAGVQVVCRSLVAGHDPVLLDEHDSFAAATAALGDRDRFVSLVPTQLHRLLETDAEALRSFHTVLLGGGPIDPALRRRAADAGVRVVTTYGSAETAGGCVYDGFALDGVALAFDRDGRIRIAGPTLFAGYEGEPERTAEVLVDGWFLTSDAGRLDEDGRLHVLGRVDDMVVSGGVNVPAPAVAARLREHPAVVAAEVLGVADEEWGTRVVAYVVVSTGSTGGFDLDEARAWVGAVHPRSWAPRGLVALDEIPLLGNGKPDRVRLRAMA
jgi:O-succinylbenzoic acid--CoA ligase